MRALHGPAAVMAVGAAPGAGAQTVALSGSFGDKALLVIDGAPHTLAAGGSSNGVRLVSVSGQPRSPAAKMKRENDVMALVKRP